MIIAIQPDDYGVHGASSPIWARLLREAGHEVREVDVCRADIFDQLHGCHGFMWRWGHASGMGRIARRLLPVIEKNLGIPVYPSQDTCWHYDDKIAQSYLFAANAIPTPKTWVWFDRVAAREWAATAEYPLVLKLAAGAGSTNVRMIRNVQEAFTWIDRLFAQRLTSLDESQFLPLKVKERVADAARLIRHGRKPVFRDNGYEAQSGYAYFQEFLPDNAFDTRVTVVGNRVFAFRRFNRTDDFRASGSGKIDHDPSGIDKQFIELAFAVAKKLNAQSCAIDGLYRAGKPVVGEVSYTYASWAVHACPGHWDETMNWHVGQMWPEEAQLQDFLAQLEKNRSGLL